MADDPPSSLSSLPHDIVLNILARVPRTYHQILSCVSKKLQSLIRSSELHKTRSILGKDCFYVCISDFPSSTFYWFTLTENCCLVQIPFPSPPEPYSTALMVGPEIYFVSGYSSKSVWILNSQSGKLRQGPNSLLSSSSAAVGLAEEKIYVFGGSCCNDKNKMEIWCVVILLHRSGVEEVQGSVEWSSCLLSNVPSTVVLTT